MAKKNDDCSQLFEGLRKSRGVSEQEKPKDKEASAKNAGETHIINFSEENEASEPSPSASDKNNTPSPLFENEEHLKQLIQNKIARSQEQVDKLNEGHFGRPYGTTTFKQGRKNAQIYMDLPFYNMIQSELGYGDSISRKLYEYVYMGYSLNVLKKALGKEEMKFDDFLKLIEEKLK